MTSTTVRHPLFARCWNRLSSLIEREAAPHRRETLAGGVVEVGAGNGMNFRHYPATVDEVLALEPESYLRARAHAAAREAPLPVSVGDAVADQLPARAQLLRHRSRKPCPVHRLRSGGRARRAAAHAAPRRPTALLRTPPIRHPDGPRVQTWLDRSGVWPRLGGGCHCARDTISAIKAAGFHIERLGDVTVGPGWVVTNPYVVGMAR